MKTSQRIEDRAKDAVARCLIAYLHVPTIFFEAPWPSRKARVDVLAIDRAGSGDVHIVQISRGLAAALQSVPATMKVPAQFRWVAYFAEELSVESIAKYEAQAEQARRAPLFSAKGMGRVGVIAVSPDEDDDTESLHAEIIVRAERFPGSYYDDADAFLKKHKPDIAFR